MTWKHRYTVPGVLFSAYMLCYLDRMVIASAIPFIAQDFQLSAMTMGGVLSAFFLGYACMQIPGGLLTDRFGPRALLVVAAVTNLVGALGYPLGGYLCDRFFSGRLSTPIVGASC